MDKTLWAERWSGLPPAPLHAGRNSPRELQSFIFGEGGFAGACHPWKPASRGTARPLARDRRTAPARLVHGLCQASSPSSPTLHGGFVKETTQLPPSVPENKTAPLCANDLPSARPPPRPPCQGEMERQSYPLCGNPGRRVLMSCRHLRASHPIPGMLLPPCGKGLPLGS